MRSSKEWYSSSRSQHYPTVHPSENRWDSSLPVSSRGLDMCLLAVCSCALSLMCHQTSGLLNMPSVSASASTSSTSSAPAQVDFMVKAGLITTRDKTAEPDEDV